MPATTSCVRSEERRAVPTGLVVHLAQDLEEVGGPEGAVRHQAQVREGFLGGAHLLLLSCNVMRDGKDEEQRVST